MAIVPVSDTSRGVVIPKDLEDVDWYVVQKQDQPTTFITFTNFC